MSVYKTKYIVRKNFKTDKEDVIRFYNLKTPNCNFYLKTFIFWNDVLIFFLNIAT